MSFQLCTYTKQRFGDVHVGMPSFVSATPNVSTNQANPEILVYQEQRMADEVTGGIKNDVIPLEICK